MEFLKQTNSDIAGVDGHNAIKRYFKSLGMDLGDANIEFYGFVESAEEAGEILRASPADLHGISCRETAHTATSEYATRVRIADQHGKVAASIAIKPTLTSRREEDQNGNSYSESESYPVAALEAAWAAGLRVNMEAFQ